MVCFVCGYHQGDTALAKDSEDESKNEGDEDDANTNKLILEGSTMDPCLTAPSEYNRMLESFITLLVSVRNAGES